MNLKNPIMRAGLDYEVGVNGSHPERQAIARVISITAKCNVATCGSGSRDVIVFHMQVPGLAEDLSRKIEVS